MCELKLTNLTAALLDPLLARDPMGPRITYYDDATGERIELSTVTLANWAAKTANLLREDEAIVAHAQGEFDGRVISHYMCPTSSGMS